MKMTWMQNQLLCQLRHLKQNNEIDQNDIAQIMRFMPKMVDKEIEVINRLGIVENFIPPHILFVRKDDSSNEILDLDNFVWNEKKELIGT